jgi:hypothetical protein
MSLRQNINKVHFDLQNRFGEVTITEKSDLKLGNYFELSILEENKEVKVILRKTEVEKNVFEWSYFSNPLNESSNLVERTSKLEMFSLDVQEVFEKNRFDSDYNKILESQTFVKDNFIGRKVTNVSQNNDITIQTGETSFSIGCSGGASVVVEGDDIIDEVISDIIINDLFSITIIFESGKKLDVEDDTGGEGLEIY